MGYYCTAEAAAGPWGETCETGRVLTGFQSVGSGYRYYSSQLGRWVSRDPIGEKGGINRYVFSANNTLLFIDLWGLSWTRDGVLAIICRTERGRWLVENIIAHADVTAFDTYLRVGDVYSDDSRTQRVETIEITPPGFYDRRTNELGIERGLSDEDAASVLVHEAVHRHQWTRPGTDDSPAGSQMTGLQRENEAFIAQYQFHLEVGMTVPERFLQDGSSGVKELNEDAIRQFVEDRYVWHRNPVVWRSRPIISPPRREPIKGWCCP